MTTHHTVNLVEASFSCTGDFKMPALVMIPESARRAAAA